MNSCFECYIYRRLSVALVSREFVMLTLKFSFIRREKQRKGGNRTQKEGFLFHSYHSVSTTYYWICSVLTEVFSKFNIF